MSVQEEEGPTLVGHVRGDPIASAVGPESSAPSHAPSVHTIAIGAGAISPFTDEKTEQAATAGTWYKLGLLTPAVLSRPQARPHLCLAGADGKRGGARTER